MITLEPVLRIRELVASYATPAGMLDAVDGVSLDLHPGESLGLVGESGCGKSTLGRALLGLMPPGGTVRGSVRIGEQELVGAGEGTLRRVRGRDMALVFQEPMTRLNPLLKVSGHFVEAIRAHRPEVPKGEARELAARALRQMGIPASRLDHYPGQFSGGMRQRIMIALGIVLRPKVVIADEPTTALDVIVEAQILDILRSLRSEQHVGLILITHNLGIVAETCDRVAVMYAGKIVESGPVARIFAEPLHPYTQGLLASTISLDTTALHSIEGAPPDLLAPPPGCRFAPRCPYRMAVCDDAVPSYAEPSPGHLVACYLHAGAAPPGQETVA